MPFSDPTPEREPASGASPAAGPASIILQRVSDGDSAAAAELLPMVYEQLRAAAAAAMKHERRDHTLQPTALVHEAFLRLLGPREVPWAHRAHFYAAAAEAMRRILIDHARARAAIKRGGQKGAGAGDTRAVAGGTGANAGPAGASAAGDSSLSPRPSPPPARVPDGPPTTADDPAHESTDFVALDEAIGRLELQDPRAARVVRLKFYAGLTMEQIASAMSLSQRTVKNDWAFARAWLERNLQNPEAAS
ncbi:MAG: sigma-70 family RNA polymerase sigma factor [Phycisphaerales bacterium]|jgi:RNA polymerase sigma factor (sigma-70 family)|nr:sigma-70 family RNA polymerase sigma factor [Phycisphaeraceae bacterium]